MSEDIENRRSQEATLTANNLLLVTQRLLWGARDALAEYRENELDDIHDDPALVGADSALKHAILEYDEQFQKWSENHLA